jgi:hypothetical protein
VRTCAHENHYGCFVMRSTEATDGKEASSVVRTARTHGSASHDRHA